MWRKGAFVHCWWDCKLVQPLWKRVWKSLKKVKVELPPVSSVESVSCVQLFVTPWTAACQASLSITNSQSLPKLISIESMMPSNSSLPSHPLPSPSPPTLNLSQHQGLFKWVSYLHQVAKVLEFLLQHQFSHIQDWFALGRTGWISLQSKGISRVFSNTTVQKHQFFGAQTSL